MSILHVPHYSHSHSLGGLLADVAHGFRAAVASLFAGRSAAQAATVPAAAPRKLDRAGLFRLARSYEDVSPSLAAELHCIGRR